MATPQPAGRNLVPPPPREVSRWFFVKRMQALLFCGVLLLGLGLAMSGLLAMTMETGIRPWADWRLDRDHLVATGRIAASTVVTSVRVNSRHPWKVEFEFLPGDDASTGPIRASGYTFDPAVGGQAVGEPVTVEYLPIDPAVARPQGGSASAMPAWLALSTCGLALAMPLVGVVLLGIMLIRAGRERRLLVEGAGATAQVISVRACRSIRFNRRHPYDVHYGFTDRGNRKFTGQDRTYHYDWAASLGPDSLVGVVYDPDRPEVNVLWLPGPLATKRR